MNIDPKRPSELLIRGFAISVTTARALELTDGSRSPYLVGVLAGIRARRKLAEWLDGWTAEAAEARLRSA